MQVSQFKKILVCISPASCTFAESLAPVLLSLQADSPKARGTARGPSSNTVQPQSPDTLTKIDMPTSHSFVATPTWLNIIKE